MKGMNIFPQNLVSKKLKIFIILLTFLICKQETKDLCMCVVSGIKIRTYIPNSRVLYTVLLIFLQNFCLYFHCIYISYLYLIFLKNVFSNVHMIFLLILYISKHRSLKYDCVSNFVITGIHQSNRHKWPSPSIFDIKIRSCDSWRYCSRNRNITN